MIFNIDENMITEAVANALESAGSQASEEQFSKIAEAIENSFPGILATLVYGMQEHWKAEARNVSTGWGAKYASAIKAKIEGNKGEVYVDESLTDKISNKPIMMFVQMIEQGMKSFSIKDAVLASEKAKESADGVKYISIPFPIATPRRPGQGTMMSKFGGREMTREMHKFVKSGGKLDVGTTLKIKNREIDITGLTRYVTRQRHEQYGIFRTVSEKSQGWQHPGVAAEPVYEKVLAEVNKKIQEVVSEFCREIVKEYTT